MNKPTRSGKTLLIALFVTFVLTVATSGCDILSDAGLIPPDFLGEIDEESLDEMTKTSRVESVEAETGSGLTGAESNVAVSQDESTYLVPGKDYTDLTNNLSTASKSAAVKAGNSSNEIAWTVFQIERNSSYQCEAIKEAFSQDWKATCNASVDVDASIGIVLPQASELLTPSDQRKWDSLVSEIRIHEEGHAEIDRESIHGLETKLEQTDLLEASAFGTDSDIAQESAVQIIEKRLDILSDQMWEENKLKQEAYHDRVGKYVDIPQ